MNGNNYTFATTWLGKHMMATLNADQCPSPPFDGSRELFAADLLQTVTSTIWSLDIELLPDRQPAATTQWPPVSWRESLRAILPVSHNREAMEP